MKSFFASLLGTLAGLAVFCGLLIALAFGGLMLLAVSEKKPVHVEPGAWLVMDLTGVNITDTPPPDDEFGLARLFGGDQAEPLGLRTVSASLRAAAADKRIAGIFLTGELYADGYGSGMAAIDELRAALAEFRKSDKKVRAFFEQPGLAEMYLASGADEIAVDPFGLVVLPGMSVEPMFFGGAFERFGVGVQVTRSGKYKGAVEPYVRKDLSAENREQLQVLLDDLWSQSIADIARDRGITVSRIQQLADAKGLVSPADALSAGLITRVAYRDEIFKELIDATGADPLDGFTQVDLRDYAKHELKKDDPFTSGRIAVVYAEGAIVDGEGNEGEVGGASFAREIRLLRQDDDVAAIVLRINSPGGSASAAEQILRELKLAREVKPVVVSMGTYAASGGYWIATAADRIYAEPTTITGSIGVFGLQINVQKLANDLGVTWDGVQTGKMAGAFSVTRPKSPAEMEIFQRLVDWTYGEFLDRVSQARGITREQVHAIAQGRVWSGAHAREVGLVDELGGLDQAIKDAAGRAGIAEDEIVLEEFPGPVSLTQTLADLFADVRPPQVRAGLLGRLYGNVTESVRTLGQFNDPRGVYARLPLEISTR